MVESRRGARSPVVTRRFAPLEGGIGGKLPRGNRLAATSPETDTPASSAQKSVNVCTKSRGLARALRGFQQLFPTCFTAVTSHTVGMLCINHLSMKCSGTDSERDETDRI